MSRPASTSSSLGDETNLLQLAYGRLVLYVKAGHGFHALQQIRDYRPEDELRVELQNIRTGPIQEILDKPYGSLISKPEGYVLRILPNQRSMNDGPKHILYEASWIRSEYKSTMLERWESDTVRDILPLLGERMADVDKYTSYEVTISMDGRQRTYRAMALYHKGYQSNEMPKVDFADNIVGQPVLTQAFYENRPPVRSAWFDYVKTEKYRQYAEASAKAKGNSLRKEETGPSTWLGEWRSENDDRKMSATLEASTSVAATMICDKDPGICDPLSCDYPNCATQKLKTRGEIRPSNLEEPGALCQTYGSTGPHVQRNVSSFQFHVSGNHSVSDDLQRYCDYDSSCNVLCQIRLINTSIRDTGLTTNACHVSGSSASLQDGGNGGNVANGAACTGTFGAGIKSCLFCACSVSVAGDVFLIP